MNTTENWGFYSPQAEAHNQCIMGLQLLNAVRGLDFLLSLPEVDATRVAMTGESGGGTQTMLTSAIDDRIKLSFPVVMVSTSMQGGCTCENASLLRIGTGNVEFAALFDAVMRQRRVSGASPWPQPPAPVYGAAKAANVPAAVGGPPPPRRTRREPLMPSTRIPDQYFQ